MTPGDAPPRIDPATLRSDALQALRELAGSAADLAGFGRGRVIVVAGERGAGGLDMVVAGPQIQDFTSPVALNAVVAGDATREVSLAAQPAVRRGVVGSYVGVPILAPDGTRLGVIEVVGGERHSLPDGLRERLARLAAVAAAELMIVGQYAELDRDRQRWLLAVWAAGVGSFDWDLVTDRLDFDAQLMTLFGYDDESWEPHISAFSRRVHPEDLAGVEAIIAEAIAVSGRYRAEYRVVWPDGTVRWVGARGQVERDTFDRPVRMMGVAYDVTEAHQARTQIARNRERWSLLSAVSEALTGRHDIADAVARLTTVISPGLSDFCIVTLIDEKGALRDVGQHHHNPTRQEMLEEYTRRRLIDVAPQSYSAQAEMSGRMNVVPFPAWENLEPLLGDPVAKHMLQELAPAFCLVVPLRSGTNETVGLLTLYNEIDSGPFGSTDQQVAAEVASRVAVALDAARVVVRQRRMAEALQRSLLTAPLLVEPWDVAVRYVPSMHDVEVGGDWYDAFPQPDGSLVVGVGDVMGHDSVAAARMGQLRSMLRGICYAATVSPAVALSQLDDAMTQLDLTGLATVVLARLESTRDGGTDVTYALAGHPPPVVVGAGRAHRVTAAADLPLGVRGAAKRADHRLHLAADEALVAYTDGLVERRGLPIDTGIDRLCALAARVGPDPEALSETVVDELTDRQLEDDIATLVVRRLPPE